MNELSNTVAIEITAAHDAALTAGRSALQHARRAGDLLAQVKAALPHGQWLPWLSAHCPTIPSRTAQVYMRIARDWPALDSKTQRVADFSIREALALLAAPRDLLADAKRLEAEHASIRVQLAGCTATLDREDATLEEVAAVLAVARDCEVRARELRLRAESGVGIAIGESKR
jgi:hypothetical protein